MKKLLSLFIILSLIILASACRKKAEGPDASSLVYPETKKVDQVDDYFGTRVADPYRWLEDDNAEEVKSWVEAQNAVTFGYLEQIPFRETIKERLMELYNYPKYSSPFRAGDYYFFYKNDGLQNQSVLYIQKGLDGQPEVFLDPNALSADGTVRVNIAGFSSDDRYTAVMRSEAGSDWREIRVMEVASKRELPDRVRWIKFSGASWYKDGFFYNRYPEPPENI
jgi:prolyl oligopeptidase